MRTTLELPDDLYRRLAERAALDGLEVRDLVTRYIERGLHELPEVQSPQTRSPIPVVVQRTGEPIAALSRAELARIDEEEELARIARPTRR